MKNKQIIEFTLGGLVSPQSKDLEDAVIGALLVDKEAYNTIKGMIVIDVFYFEKNKLIFIAMNELYSKSMPIDTITVINQLKKNGTLDAVGGAYEVTTLETKIFSAANIESHALMLIEKYIRRESIKAGLQLAKNSYDDTVDVFTLLSDLEKTADIINFTINNNSNAKVNPMQDFMELIEGKTELFYIFFLDSMTKKFGGITMDGVTILAGRPGDGKTSFMLHQSLYMAKIGIPNAFISLEMSTKQLRAKYLALHLNIPVNNIIYNNKRSREEKSMLMKGVDDLMQLPLSLTDDSFSGIDSIIAYSLKLHRDGICVFFIDYLGLIPLANKDRRDVEIGEIVRRLHVEGKKHGIKYILGCQLGRAAEGAVRYSTAHLRDSGQIEEHATQVFFVNRVANRETIKQKNGAIDSYGEVIFSSGFVDDTVCLVEAGKNRFGTPNAVVRIEFEGKTQKFSEYTEYKNDVKEQPKELKFSVATEDIPF